MNSLANLGAAPLTLIASLLIAVVLLAIRVTVMQRIQQRRQRENRQESERLRSLIAAYRLLAGSFTPAAPSNAVVVEEALADLVLFGTVEQVALAAECARRLKAGEPLQTQELVDNLRADLRVQLGLDEIPASIQLPPSGPGQSLRAGRGGGEGGGRMAGGGAAGGGGGGGGAAAGGLGTGLILGDLRDPG